MSTSKTLRLWLGIPMFAFGVIALVIIGFFHFNPLCGEETKQELRSPDGRYVAVWMERNCGATTLYFEHVNLRRAARNFWSDFFDGTVKEGEVFGFEQRGADSNLRITWSGNRTLKIENACDERTWKLAAWHDVSITYTDSTCITGSSDALKLHK